MTLLTYTQPHIIIPEKGKHIREKKDVYVPEHIDPESGILIPEHFPYYSTLIFVPDYFTEEQMLEKYEEEDIDL